jgi:phosphate-selective porin
MALTALCICFGAQAQETKGEKFHAFADKYLKLSGYLQGGFEWSENTDPESTFYLKRARVSLSGNAADEKIDYRLQVDMAGSPKICDLYVRYKPLNELSMQIGQFKVPFAIENELCGPTTFEFIEYSYITTYFSRNNAAYDGIAATGRDIGFQLFGGFIEQEGYNIINYNLAVFNGAGINNKDNNSSKDVVARLMIKPIKGLSLSGSYMYAETEFAGAEYMKSPRWSVGAWYNSRHCVARAEYAEAEFGAVRSQSLYALAGYHFEKPWSLVARYEFIKDNYDILNQERITLGGVYKPFNFLRLQLNLSYVMNDTPVSALGANLMVSAIF